MSTAAKLVTMPEGKKKQQREKDPMPSLLNPDFKYTPAEKTDLAKKFRRIKRELQVEAAKKVRRIK